MAVSPPAPPDAADMATAVRSLAHHSHRVLNDPASTLADARELSESAASLRRRLRGRSQVVAHWLDNLERRLAERFPQD